MYTSDCRHLNEMNSCSGAEALDPAVGYSAAVRMCTVHVQMLSPRLRQPSLVAPKASGEGFRLASPCRKEGKRYLGAAATF